VADTGVSCDNACYALGGANLAYLAEHAWDDSGCDGGADKDDVSWAFYHQGNPGKWGHSPLVVLSTSPGIRSIRRSVPLWKCSTGSNVTIGAYQAFPTQQRSHPSVHASGLHRCGGVHRTRAVRRRSNVRCGYNQSPVEIKELETYLGSACSAAAAVKSRCGSNGLLCGYEEDPLAWTPMGSVNLRANGSMPTRSLYLQRRRSQRRDRGFYVTLR